MFVHSVKTSTYSKNISSYLDVKTQIDTINESFSVCWKFEVENIIFFNNLKVCSPSKKEWHHLFEEKSKA